VLKFSLQQLRKAVVLLVPLNEARDIGKHQHIKLSIPVLCVLVTEIN